MWVSEAAKPYYLDLLEKSLKNEKLFRHFKSTSQFMGPVGLTEAYCGALFKQHVLTVPEVAKNLPVFERNDTLGSPLSKDTWRFADTVARLYTTFGDLSHKVIVELGSNYGGLAYCLLSQWPDVNTYHLLDLPIVQEFSLYYLKTLGGIDINKFSTKEPETIDLFISEYCLTEFTDDDLYAFYEKYAKNAKNIFIRCNLVDANRQMKFITELRYEFDLEIVEEPVLRKPNIVICGKR